MTPASEALIRDTEALVRESRHVKRAAGWADITAQLVVALRDAEDRAERAEKKVQELAEQLDHLSFQVMKAAADAATTLTQPAPEAEAESFELEFLPFEEDALPEDLFGDTDARQG